MDSIYFTRHTLIELAEQKVVFTGSSLLRILNTEADLSRRCIFYNKQGLSYREFLKIYHDIDIPSFTLDEVLFQSDDVCTKINQQCRPLANDRASIHCSQSC